MTSQVFQLTEETNSEKLAKHYNVKIPVEEAKYTKDELVDKFGTDDLYLINAGNEEDVDIDLENPDLEEGFWEFDQEDDEPTATCPDCGEEMTYIGAQGYDEEFKCPVCGEYHYLRKGKLV